MLSVMMKMKKISCFLVFLLLFILNSCLRGSECLTYKYMAPDSSISIKVPYHFRSDNLMFIGYKSDNTCKYIDKFAEQPFAFQKPYKQDTIVLYDEFGINLKCKMKKKDNKLYIKFLERYVYLDLDTTTAYMLNKCKCDP